MGPEPPAPPATPLGPPRYEVRRLMSIAGILDRVSSASGYPVEQIQSRDRYGRIVDARQAAAILMREIGCSKSEIGRVLGRDHSTIVSLLRRDQSDSCKFFLAESRGLAPTLRVRDVENHVDNDGRTPSDASCATAPLRSIDEDSTSLSTPLIRLTVEVAGFSTLQGAPNNNSSVHRIDISCCRCGGGGQAAVSPPENGGGPCDSHD